MKLCDTHLTRLREEAIAAFGPGVALDPARAADFNRRHVAANGNLRPEEFEPFLYAHNSLIYSALCHLRASKSVQVILDHACPVCVVIEDHSTCGCGGDYNAWVTDALKGAEEFFHTLLAKATVSVN
jgi:hypothetical protein